MRYIKVSILAFMLFLQSCGKDDDISFNPEDFEGRIDLSFEPFGLDGRKVNELFVHNDELFAATDNGIYASPLDVQDWTLQNDLEGKNIKAIEIISESQMIASEIGVEYGKLWETKNGGQSWNEIVSDFGGDYFTLVFDLEYELPTNKLYACGVGVIAVSDDLGRTFKPIWGSWDSGGSGLDFVEKNPYKNELWSSGQGALENLITIKYDLTTGTVKVIPDPFFNAPSTGKAILFDSKDPNRIIIGVEGGIILSEDGGDTWQLIKDATDSFRFYLGLERDPDFHNVLYAGGWIKPRDSAQPFIISYSTDNGLSWTDIEYENTSIQGGVFSMTSVQGNNEYQLLVGLDKGGVYRVTVNKFRK